MGRIPAAAVRNLTPKSIESVWLGAAQTGGHRSDEIQYPQVLPVVASYVRKNAWRLPAPTVAGTFLYRLADEQPFGDCNKRTGMIIATGMMEAAGYRLVRPNDEVSRYLNLFATNHPNRRAFVRWFAASFVESEPAGPSVYDE
jgi:prophage maintenance system killer protein